MEFCVECKGLLLPKKDILVCRQCKKEYPKKGNNQELKFTEKRVAKEIITVSEEDTKGLLPTTTVICDACGNNTAYWWLRQLRSADESEVRFFRCTECKKTWREYD